MAPPDTSAQHAPGSASDLNLAPIRIIIAIGRIPYAPIRINFTSIGFALAPDRIGMASTWIVLFPKSSAIAPMRIFPMAIRIIFASIGLALAPDRIGMASTWIVLFPKSSAIAPMRILHATSQIFFAPVPITLARIRIFCARSRIIYARVVTILAQNQIFFARTGIFILGFGATSGQGGLRRMGNGMKTWIIDVFPSTTVQTIHSSGAVTPARYGRTRMNIPPDEVTLCHTPINRVGREGRSVGIGYEDPGRMSMTLAWVIWGSIGQLMLAMFLFMFVAFSGGGMGSLRTLTPMQDAVLTLSLFALPASCVVSAVAVIYCYRSGASPTGYWWYALPAALAAAYFVYAMILNNQPPSR